MILKYLAISSLFLSVACNPQTDLKDNSDDIDESSIESVYSIDNSNLNSSESNFSSNSDTLLNESLSGDRIYFGFDQYNVSQYHIQNISIIIDYINNSDFKSITIEGHADERGTRDYNVSLGQKRANSLKKLILENSNIPEKKITIISYGKENPITKCVDSSKTCSGPKVWAKNRLALIKINQ